MNNMTHTGQGAPNPAASAPAQPPLPPRPPMPTRPLPPAQPPTPYFVRNGRFVPGQFVVGADGQVVCVPARGAGRRGSKPALDEQGRERGFMLTRRSNSAALALLLDTALVLFVTAQVIDIAISILAAIGLIDVYGLSMLFIKAAESGNADLFTENAMNYISDKIDWPFIGGLAAVFASFIGHTLSAYIHSVRNGFSCMSTLRRGAKTGSLIPRAGVMLIGVTYGWLFICMYIGKVWPGSVFGGDMTTNSMEGLSLAAQLASVVSTCVVAPLCEEFLFRGVLLKSFSRYGTGFALVVTSVLFGLLHGNPFQTPFTTVGGFILGYLAIRSGSIWPGVVVHFILNSFSTVRELLEVHLPAPFAAYVEPVCFAISGLCILGTVVILIAGARKIKLRPIDPERNNILLPRVATRVRFKYLRTLFSFFMLLFVAACVLSIIVYIYFAKY